MSLTKLAKQMNSPDYERQIPEDVRVGNSEKVSRSVVLLRRDEKALVLISIPLDLGPRFASRD